MRRLPGLDLLRAVAILSVICTHAWIAGGMGTGFGWIEQYGWMGVDLFFVLSGYLIGRQVLTQFKHEGSLDLWAFYRQRAYRILPAYLVVVALYFGLPALREQSAIQPVWQFLTFTMNLFVDQSTMHSFSSAWSLCVEEHFYLVFPLIVIAFAPRSNKWRLIAALFCIVAFEMAWRGYAWWQSAGPASDGSGLWEMDGHRYMELIYYPTYARLDGLLAGVAIAVLCVYRPALWGARKNAPIASRFSAAPQYVLQHGYFGTFTPSPHACWDFPYSLWASHCWSSLPQARTACWPGYDSPVRPGLPRFPTVFI
jgi:peptidoglycan/LPS O-acetylase OafA/YrhL